jgi:hypothetical protein
LVLVWKKTFRKECVVAGSWIQELEKSVESDFIQWPVFKIWLWARR